MVNYVARINPSVNGKLGRHKSIGQTGFWLLTHWPPVLQWSLTLVNDNLRQTYWAENPHKGQENGTSVTVKLMTNAV